MPVEDSLLRLVSNQKNTFDQKRGQAILPKLNTVLPHNCVADILLEEGTLEIKCANEELVKSVMGTLPYFLHWIQIFERIHLTDQESSRIRSISVEDLRVLRGIREKKGIRIMQTQENYSTEALRIVERVMRSPKPASVVSLDFHRNLIFNEALTEFTGSSGADLLKRDLRWSWLLPSELTPNNIHKIEQGSQIPPQLDEMISNLRQQQILDHWHYRIWNGRSFGNCVAHIEYVKFMGADCRLIFTEDFEELPPNEWY